MDLLSGDQNALWPSSVPTRIVGSSSSTLRIHSFPSCSKTTFFPSGAIAASWMSVPAKRTDVQCPRVGAAGRPKINQTSTMDTTIRRLHGRTENHRGREGEAGNGTSSTVPDKASSIAILASPIDCNRCLASFLSQRRSRS